VFRPACKLATQGKGNIRHVIVCQSQQSECARPGEIDVPWIITVKAFLDMMMVGLQWQSGMHLSRIHLDTVLRTIIHKGDHPALQSPGSVHVCYNYDGPVLAEILPAPVYPSRGVHRPGRRLCQPDQI